MMSNDFTIFDSQLGKPGNSVVSFVEHQKKDIKRLLAIKFKQSNGKLCDMFAIVLSNDGIQRYRCVLCSKGDMGVSKCISHAKSKKHKRQVRDNYSSSIPNKVRATSNDNKVLSEFQTHLNQIYDQVIIGAEYIIEVNYGKSFESNFHCVLCDGRFNVQVIVNHLTAYAHRSKYLEKHFPTAFKLIAKFEKREQKYSCLETVCQNIEDYYGRLSIKIIPSYEFSTNQMKFYGDILNATHFDETLGRTFTEVLHNGQGMLSPVSDYDDITSTCSLESLSTSSEFTIGPFKASDNVLLSSSSPDRKRKIRSEKGREFDHENKSRSSRYTRHGGQRPLEKEFNKSDFCRTKGKESSSMRKHSYYRSNSNSSYLEKQTWKIKGKESTKERRYTKQERRKSRVQTNRDRSRSRQRHQSSIKGCDEYSHRKSTTRPQRSVETGSESQSALGDTFRHNYSTIGNPMTLCKNYSPIQTSVESECDDDGPITIISVLSLLAACENLLGSLAPKMIGLMTEAIEMEKIGVNCSKRLLDNHNHWIVFETTKEKLKGVLRADLVEQSKRKTLKKIVDDMDVLINEADARKHTDILSQLPEIRKLPKHQIDAKETSAVASPCPIDDRSAIANKMLEALKKQGKSDTSRVELELYVEQYLEMIDGKKYDSRGTNEMVDKSHPECDDVVFVPATNSKSTEIKNEKRRIKL